MYTKVDFSAPKTREFTSYLFQKLLDHYPLSIGEVVEVEIKEGDTPLPKVLENILKDEEGKVIATLESIEGDRGLLKFEGENKNRSVEIIDQTKRDLLRENAVIDYVEQTFEKLCPPKIPFVKSRSPLHILFPLLVKNPKGIYSEAKKLGCAMPGERQPSQGTPIDKSATLPEVYYHRQSGLGAVNGKRFQFKNSRREFKIFAEMYERIGEPVPRRRVLELLGLQEAADATVDKLMKGLGRKNTEHTLNTIIISEVANSMREKTSLSTNQLVINNGDLTLLARKTEAPPK